MLLYLEFFNRHHEAAMIITILVLAVSGFILLTGSSDESKKPIVKVGGILWMIAAIFVLGATGLLRLPKIRPPVSRTTCIFCSRSSFLAF